MQTYLVGGAVRDELLGLPVKERDYVVVGSTPDEMLEAGYRPVGKDFPVFLHPVTKEEFALARTERKVGPGHTGFVCHASPEVTLVDDLKRRDLTINAIAQDTDGTLIDPYHGTEDLSAHILRHVSDAFSEDPLRILRLARFKARFHHLGFEIAVETTQLAQQMTDENLLSELPPERILAELNKALATPDPAQFFFYLDSIGAHAHLWPEISRGGPELLSVHPQITNVETRFVLLLQDTTSEKAATLCKRLRCSSSRTEITGLVLEHKQTWTALKEMTADSIVRFFYEIDALRRVERFQTFNQICAEIPSEEATTTLREDWQRLADIAGAVKAADVAPELNGVDIGAAIKAERIRRVTQLLNQLQN